MPLTLPVKLAEKAATFSESTFGACRVILVLKDGEKVFDVTLAWGSEIVKIDGEDIDREKLGFGVTDIIDVLPWS